MCLSSRMFPGRVSFRDLNPYEGHAMGEANDPEDWDTVVLP